MIGIILVSKQANVCRTLRQFIGTDPELEIMAEVSGSDEALEKVDLLSPNILLINSGGSDTDAISLAERVLQRKPRTFVILLMQQLTLDGMQAASTAGCHNVAS
ncbi:MAG: hypothetical protein PUC47_01850, partial [Oscillospiraceae bacterium]|nr:hypothetical protein [Oscillospiraceae bacterium]